jgi:uncharacterized phage protein (TIGR02220 family)
MSEINIHKGTATIFHESGKPYTSISNEVVSTIRNTDALAIWAFLQSKSNDWTVIGTFLMSHFNLGRKRYSDAMRCLKDYGLIEYRINRDDSGKIVGNKIIVMYEFKSSPIPTETDMSVNPQSGEPALPLKAPLPIKDSITHEGLDNKEPLSGKPDVDAVEKSLLDYLNTSANRNYKPVPSNIKLLKARLAEGHTPQEIADVIARKCAEWLDDPKMNQYLRPATLFNAEKFNTYVGQLNSPLPVKHQTRPDHMNGYTHGEKLQEEYRRFLNGHETAEQNNQRLLAKNVGNLQPGLVEYNDDVGF